VTGLRIGTRRSPLAIAQAEEVRIRLAERGVDGELVPMSTAGDEDLARIAELPAGLKGLWTDAIVEALIEERIDLAVHSAKDLPAEEEDGLALAAVPERADPADVLVLREEGVLPAGAAVGTTSVRRRAQLLAAFPGIAFVDLRGNLDTRLRKLEAGEADAAV
jgi:hydroxymethylbilane synthase